MGINKISKEQLKNRILGIETHRRRNNLHALQLKDDNNSGGLHLKMKSSVVTKENPAGLIKNIPDPLITIITPVYNGARFLEETILSVLCQDYENIEYIIIDGGSSDGTIDILKKYENYIDLWISEPDDGMYDAIHKGFRLANGEIYSWINSDDLYFRGTINIVSNIFKNKKVHWITGVPNSIDTLGHHIGVEHPKFYPRLLIKWGFFRPDSLGCIQQESTFFRSTLYNLKPLNTSYQLAGDYHLWRGFSKFQKLYTIKATLAAFRIHESQKSSDREKYLSECNTHNSSRIFNIITRLSFFKFILKPLIILSDHRLVKITSSSNRI